MSKYEIFDLFFAHQVKYMCAGIEATMNKKESVYTCALALSTYTEIMGGLVTGKLKDKTQSHNNYDKFLPYLGQKYVELNELIKTKYKKELENLYSAVRSKLVHEFALRGSHAIFFYEKAHEDKIGIDLTVPKIIVNNTEIKGIPHINFLIPEYYRDFKTAIAKYYNDLKNWKNNQDILNNFLQATVDNFQSEEPK